MKRFLASLGIRVALWFSGLFAPVQKEPKELEDAKSLHLRFEFDLATRLDGAHIASILRRVATGTPYESILVELAQQMEGNSRRTARGTRGTSRCEGDALKVLKDDGVTFDRDNVGAIAEILYRKTRELTRDPGNLKELQISFVVESLATTKEESPLTSFSVSDIN